MLLFGHIGLTIGFFYLISLLTKRKFNYSLVIVGSILPDLIDKPLGRIILPLGSGRLIGHTLAFILILIIIGIIFSLSWQMLTIALADGLHLIEDRMWSQSAILLWPLLGGFQVHKAVSINDYAMGLLQGFHPAFSMTFVSEALGFGILMAFLVIRMRKGLKGS